ncbi:nadph-dependent fmn reductase [Trichoderma arundinaceum]|uniref:Nadph-dependent fmn reductase n=1 Tax=Trichoderma arundinaceum TaxID=490622 RepID=A0A395NX64_TRIAR|nr:nadph-dependent fmn reductase [Trichoderma arundinaceum]
MATSKSIAVIISSTRPHRINPFVAGYVASVIQSVPQTTANVELLDLATVNLPLYNEPAVPGDIPVDDPTPHYQYEHTRAWSTLVRKYDGFVFVTPQYNWSIPSSLKNALDYVFHEWSGKPAAIVTYGFRGGVKAEPHLRDVLKGLRMNPVESTVALKIVKGEPEERERLMKELWQNDGAEEKIKALFANLLNFWEIKN